MNDLLQIPPEYLDLPPAAQQSSALFGRDRAAALIWPQFERWRKTADGGSGWRPVVGEPCELRTRDCPSSA
jgi:hypothetical protein